MAARKTASHETELALVKQELNAISGKLKSIEQQLETRYAQATELALVRLEIAEMRRSSVTQDQYWPVKMLVFGAAAVILTSALGALLALVITRQA